MHTIKINIDGREIAAKSGQTILEVCNENNIPIPTLCHDEQLSLTGNCWVCAVRVKHHGLVTSCTAKVANGMHVDTKGPEVVQFRQRILETILSEHYGDCVAPCQVACPAGIDIQGYLALIARGQYSEAISLIKERLPMPGTIGRICPRFCERECRRSILEEPISICTLKRFAADKVLENKSEPKKQIAPKTGKKIAVIGAGPAGVSAAYYLTLKGHQVTMFEALPEPGGMLRYGVPDYRLPWDILKGEIDQVTSLGATLLTNRKLGKDFTIKSLFDDGYTAIFRALGAQISQKMKIDGEDITGVYSGTDFLRDVVLK